ncbi:MAG: short-chain dehydrogenase [Bacteroidetes bacterium]|nr:MAG: short-chain dehydrogenase [Bacteroidota bacterium]
MNIIITGASRGIGKEVAIQLANSGENRVIAIARDEKKLNTLEKEVKDPARVIPIAFDLRNGDYELLSKEIRGHFSEIHVLINNAGILINKKISRLSADDFDQMMDVNVKSAFLLIQALIPLFEPNGHIVNISSMGGVQGSAKFPGLSLYSASKGALAILSECMAEELKDYNISVNCLALGAAQTEMLTEAFPAYKAPLSAEQMASYIADFALKGQQFFNGKILPVSLSTP